VKRVLLCGLAAFALLASSFSEKLAAQDFSGTYFGAHVGYRWVDADLTTPDYPVPQGFVPARNESYSPDGAILGVHLGHMKKIRPNWYIGLEGDLSLGWGDDGISGASRPCTFECAETATPNSTVDANWQGTIRARLGYQSGRSLFYLTGGLAFMDVEWKDTLTSGATYTASKDEVLTGWVLGAGIHYLWKPNWLFRIEYLYEDLGDMSVPLAGTTETGTLDVTAQKLRIGISYKFGQRPQPLK